MTHPFRPALAAAAVAAVLITSACGGASADRDGKDAAPDAAVVSDEQSRLVPAGTLLWSLPIDNLYSGDVEYYRPDGAVVAMHDPTAGGQQEYLLRHDVAPTLIAADATFSAVDSMRSLDGQDLVLVNGTYDGQVGLYAFDIATEEVVYTIPTAEGSGRVSLTGDSVVIEGGTTRAYRLSDGTPQSWDPPAPSGAAAIDGSGEDYLEYGDGNGSFQRYDTKTGLLEPYQPPQITITGDSASFRGDGVSWTATGLPPAPKTDGHVMNDRLVFQASDNSKLLAVVHAGTGEVMHSLDLTSMQIQGRCEPAGMMSPAVLLVYCEIQDSYSYDDQLLAFAVEPTEMPADADEAV